MGDHPRSWAVCSLGNLATGSEDQAKGLGLLTDLQSLRWHGSRFKAKHQPPEYKAGKQNRNWGNRVSETQTHSLTLGYGRGLVKWKQARLHTWNGHKIRIRLRGHWTWEPLAYWFSVPSSPQSPKDRGLVPGTMAKGKSTGEGQMVKSSCGDCQSTGTKNPKDHYE